MALVLDASAVLPWCFIDEASPVSDTLLQQMKAGEQAFVPAHWPTEVLSALLRGKRRGRIDDIGIKEFLDDLASLDINVEQSLLLNDLAGLKALSERLQINAYDAVYLDLARSTGLALATGDDALIRGCVIEGVQVIPAR